MDSRWASWGTVSFAFVALVCVGVVTATNARAQMADERSPWTVNAQGGLAIPTGDLADLPIESTGVGVGLGLAYRVSPRFAIRADAGAEFYGGSFAEAPSIRFFRYDAGLEAEVTPPGSPLDVVVNVGGGFTKWDTERGVPTPSATFTETYPTVNGGLRVGYDVVAGVNLFARGQWYMQFTDEQETAPLAELSTDLSGGFGTASSAPISLGLSWTP